MAIHSIEICIYSHDGCVHISIHTLSLLVTNQELPVTFEVVELNEMLTFTIYSELNEMLTFTIYSELNEMLTFTIYS